MLPLERLTEEPYSSIICYPRVAKLELAKRLRELQKLGVTALEFRGKKLVSNVPVSGKGCVGIVVTAYRNRERVALKIRRVDADRSRMQREAGLLKKANSVNVGPTFLGASRDFLLMQFLEGDLLPEWLAHETRIVRVRKVLRSVLEQCWRLDQACLDHGELSHAPKHIIVDGHGDPFIVDFETASVKRRSSNVTSICQYLFIGGVAKEVAHRLGSRGSRQTLEALKVYKKCMSNENFKRVLKACGL